VCVNVCVVTSCASRGTQKSVRKEAHPYTHVCVCARVNVCMRVLCLHPNTSTYTRQNTHTHKYKETRAHANVHTHEHAHANTCMRARTFTLTHTNTHTTHKNMRTTHQRKSIVKVANMHLLSKFVKHSQSRNVAMARCDTHRGLSKRVWHFPTCIEYDFT